MTVKVTQLGTFVAVGQGYPRVGADGDHTFSATVVGVGAVSTTIAIMASNDLVGWTQIATLNASSSSGVGAAAAAITASYVYWRADVTALSAGAQVSAIATTEEAYGSGGGAGPALAMTGPPPLTATVGTAYTIDFGATGGMPPYVFGSTGTLPPGLPVVNPSTGVASAAPTTAGSYTFTGTVIDALGATATLGPFTVVVSAAVLPDTTAPVMSGSITTSNVTQTSYTMAWPSGTDNVGIVAYQSSVDGGSTWVGRGLAVSAAITGRTAGTTDQLRVRALDAAGNISNVLSGTVTLAAASGATNTKPKFGYGPANSAGTQSVFDTMFAAATDLPGSSNGGRSSTNFSTVVTTDGGSPPVTLYPWVFVLASAANTGGGQHFSDGTGAAGWDGANSTGAFSGIPTDPTTHFLVYTNSAGTWNAYRGDSKAINFSTWSIS